jgi:predicted DNA-binding transcriptional regulator YafY
MDTLYRRALILSMIPQKGTITTAQIEERLQVREVSRRMIQRDLEILSGQFPLTYEIDGKTYFWSWTESARFSIPAMEPNVALTFYLTNQFIAQLLPKSSLKSLKPYFRGAQTVFDNFPETMVSLWPDKVRVIPRGVQMRKPAIDEDLLDAVYEAVLKERQMDVVYRRRNEECTKIYRRLNPLGLVFVEGLIYLVASYGENTQALQFLLHRMESATLLSSDCVIPKGFSLQLYIENGEFSYPVGKDTIRLKALFARSEAAYLYETPPPGTVSLTDHDAETVLLEAELPDSLQLRWWLKGFGDNVEVLEPRKLRREFREMAKRLAGKYAKL